MDIEKNQIHALFDEFYKAVIPEMRPLHIYKYDYEGQKRFWFERFREAFFSEQPSQKNQSYTELPVMWLAGFRNKASAVPVLDKPAKVGGGTFQKGIKWSTVIGAAQRHYEYSQKEPCYTKNVHQLKGVLFSVPDGYVLVPKDSLSEAVEKI